MNCGRVGALSLLTLVPRCQVDADGPGDDPWEPIVVHLTVCREHVRHARVWLAERTPEGVDTYGTEFLMREWGQIVDRLEGTPVLSMVRTA